MEKTTDQILKINRVFGPYIPIDNKEILFVLHKFLLTATYMQRHRRREKFKSTREIKVDRYSFLK